MNAVSDALKLTAYAGERDRVGGVLLADALLHSFAAHRIRSGLLLRGTTGFGAHHRLRTDRLLSLSEDLTIVAEAVDRPERIDALVPDVLAVCRRGLVTVERARMLTAPPAPATGPGGAATCKLTLHLGRKARIGAEPAFVAVTRALHRAGADAAIALLGVDGVREGERRRARFFGRNAEVPIAVTALGAQARIAAALEAVGPLPDAVITVERVQVCKRDGELLASPASTGAHDIAGRDGWQKLTVHAPEDARSAGRPLHEAIVARLRETGCAGATSLRGIWGFHGRRPPHGDRLLALRRHVPVITVVVDAPERIGSAFAEIDRLTGHEGLLTSEIVPVAGWPDSGRGSYRQTR